MLSRLLLAFILVVGMACSDSDKLRNNAAPKSSFTAEEKLDRIQLDGSLSSDPDHDPITFSWTNSASLVVQKGDAPDMAYFKLPEAAPSGPVTIQLRVSDGRQTDDSVRSIDVPQLTQSRAFGLGKNLTSQLSLDANYEWYLDQANTGPYSLVNCGPTVVTMAIKWAKPAFAGTPVDARNTYRSSGGWWYTNDIDNYLRQNDVTTWSVKMDGLQVLRDELDAGNIAILCLDMYYVPSLSQLTGSEYHRDKFYDTSATGWGHFIVIKGYKIVDGTLFFEAFDPYSLGAAYSDHTLKGKNRYYTSTSLDQATDLWWDYAIIVSKNAIPGGRRMLSTEEIVPMPGR